MLIEKEKELVENKKQLRLEEFYDERSKRNIEEINEKFAQLKKNAESYYIFSEEREKALHELEKERLKEIINYYQNLQKERQLTKKETEELQDAITDLNKMNNKVIEDSFKNIQDSVKNMTDQINNIMKSLDDIRMKSLEDMSDAISRDADLYKELIIRGNAAAMESYMKVVEEEKKLREELKRERQKQLRREVIFKLISAFSNLTSTTNSQNALASVINALTSIVAAVNSAGLYRGTEYVNRRHGVELKNKIIDSVLVRLNIGERVISAEDNKKISHLSNEELIKKATADDVQVKYDYNNLENVLIKIIKSKNSTIRERRYL